MYSERVFAGVVVFEGIRIRRLKLRRSHLDLRGWSHCPVRTWITCHTFYRYLPPHIDPPVREYESVCTTWATFVISCLRHLRVRGSRLYL